MSDKEFDNTEMAKWDPGFTEMAKKVVAPFVNLWFRARCGVWSPFRRPAAQWWCVTTQAVC